MTTLTPTQWNTLTFIQHYGVGRGGRYPRASDIQAGCGLESRRQTRDILDCLARKGLVQLIDKRINGHTVLYARKHPCASGMVGVEVPVLEVEREKLQSIEA